MFKILLSIFLLLHVLGDFYFQTDRISEKKNAQYRYVILHSLIYAAVFFAGVVPIWSVPAAWMILVLVISHYAVDSLKYLGKKRIRFIAKASDEALYLADQSLHLLSFIIVAFFAVWKGISVSLQPWMGNLLALAGLSGKAVLGWLCVLLLICKPANITIKLMLAKYRPVQENDVSNNAGAFIGSLERTIITLLLSAGQYAAIGLILTAKSVARYDRISKDQIFAEYYLLGTLLSTLFAIAAFLVFK